MKIAFILVSSIHGTMIINRLDEHRVLTNTGPRSYGVGYELLEDGSYENDSVNMLAKMVDQRRKHYGDGVVMLDCGANIGTHTIPLAFHMNGWGDVHAFEPQEFIFYALCGNIAINNCPNAHAFRKAVGDRNRVLGIPVPDYWKNASYGSMELQQTDKSEHIGQDLGDKRTPVEMLTVDSLVSLSRVDVMKIDVEGMELDVLHGADRTICNHHPIIMLEWTKINQERLLQLLKNYDYVHFMNGRNVLAVWKQDPTLQYLTAGAEGTK